MLIRPKKMCLMSYPPYRNNFVRARDQASLRSLGPCLQSVKNLVEVMHRYPNSLTTWFEPWPSLAVEISETPIQAAVGLLTRWINPAHKFLHHRTQEKEDKYPCSQWDSNSCSQQASDAVRAAYRVSIAIGLAPWYRILMEPESSLLCSQ